MHSDWMRREERLMADWLVDVRGLSIGYEDALGHITMAAQDVSFQVPAGGSLGIVGESGSGKSTVARALLGHYRGGGRRTAGTIEVAGHSMESLTREQLSAVRGIEMAFVPQNPLSSLTHHMRVGEQLVEILSTRAGLDSRSARRRALELFEATRLPDPSLIFNRYPHQLSGGQRQRVVIACALACRPRLLILDEPTTALDKTTEAQVLDLVNSLRSDIGAGLVLVTHDLNVVASSCDQVVVMKDGGVVEQGKTGETFKSPRSPYTRELVGSVLSIDEGPANERQPVSHESDRQQTPVLSVRTVGHQYQRSSWWSRSKLSTRAALTDVSLQLGSGEILGIVGESGSGKSTLGSIVAGLMAPSQGTLTFHQKVLRGGSAARTDDQRRRIQMIFQDPLSSLNPRQSVGSAIARPLRHFFGLTREQARVRAAALLAELGMEEEYLSRFPRQLSGGQQQRVAIARAFAAEPDLIICDEVTSALDATVQGQVLSALAQMQRKRSVAMLLITHDLSVIWRLAQRVLVLKDGVIHDAGPVRQVFANPSSPYTRSLLQAATQASRLGLQAAGS